MDAPTHEGKRLEDALRRHGKSQADLARATGTSRAYVSRLIDTPRYKPGAWDTVQRGLVALGISEREVRDMATKNTGTRYADAIETLNGASEAELKRLRKVLAHTPDVLEVLRLIVDERLKK